MTRRPAGSRSCRGLRRAGARSMPTPETTVASPRACWSFLDRRDALGPQQRRLGRVPARLEQLAQGSQGTAHGPGARAGTHLARQLSPRRRPTVLPFPLKAQSFAVPLALPGDEVTARLIRHLPLRRQPRAVFASQRLARRNCAARRRGGIPRPAGTRARACLGQLRGGVWLLPRFLAQAPLILDASPLPPRLLRARRGSRAS